MPTDDAPTGKVEQALPYGRLLAIVSALTLTGSAAATLAWYDPASAIFGGLSFLIAVAGILISLAGFSYTLIQLSRTRHATVAVNDALKSLRSKMNLVDVSSEATKVVKLLENSTIHLGHRSWSSAAFSLWEAQRSLYRLKGNLILSDEGTEIVSRMTENLLIEVQNLEALGAKSVLDFDYSSLVHSIRVTMNVIDNAIIERQKEIYDA